MSARAGRPDAGAARRTRARRRLRLLALAAAALLAAGAAAAEEEGSAADGGDAVTSWYARAVGRGERGMVVTDLWSKGPLFRAEMVVAGRRIVTLVNGEHYYNLDATTGRGIAIRRPERALEADASRSRPFGTELEDLLEAGGEKVGSETLGGRRCELYRVTDERGRRSVCVDPERRLPVRVERFHRASGRTDGVDYVSWISGLPLPQLLFEPDPRYEIEFMELEEYRRRSRQETVGPAPVLYGDLLYGR